MLLDKVDASDKSPLSNVVFKIKDTNGVYLHFALQEDSKTATVSTLTMDANAQAFVCGLPAAKYRLVESVVPSGFFPAPAQDFTLLLTHTSEKPLEITVTNTPEVKPGLDSDKWDDVLLIGGGILLWKHSQYRR